MQKFLYLVMAALLALPMTTFAAVQEDAMISELQKQIQELSGELEELSDRLDGAERHATLDRIEFSGDLRARAHSLHYQDVTFNPGINVNFDKSFDTLYAPVNPFNPGQPMAGITGGDLDMAQAMVDGLSSDPVFADALNRYPGLDKAFVGYLAYPSGALGTGIFPMSEGPQTSNINNDVMYDSRLRLNMKAKVWDNVKFAGRLAMYKNWGDSTGTQVFDSWRAFTMDATNGGNTTGDILHVDRAYMDWSNIADTGMYLSIGRRPSTYGPPTEIRENELRGGTPTGNVMNLNFDGITIGRSLEDITGRRVSRWRSPTRPPALRPT